MLPFNLSVTSEVFIPAKSQVDSAFYPPWNIKMSTSQTAVPLCGWEGNAGLAETNAAYCRVDDL